MHTAPSTAKNNNKPKLKGKFWKHSEENAMSHCVWSNKNKNISWILTKIVKAKSWSDIFKMLKTKKLLLIIFIQINYLSDIKLKQNEDLKEKHRQSQSLLHLRSTGSTWDQRVRENKTRQGETRAPPACTCCSHTASWNVWTGFGSTSRMSVCKWFSHRLKMVDKWSLMSLPGRRKYNSILLHFNCSLGPHISI